MLSDIEANSLVRGLVFAVQKTRSDIKEGLGVDGSPSGKVAESLLEDLHPLLFGQQSIFTRLLDWQERCKATGIIAGSDLFNLTKYIDMSASRPVLGLLPVYGYPAIPEDGPPIEWFGKSWPYLTDGLS